MNKGEDMKSFPLEFNDDTEKIIIIGMTLCAIVLSFLSPLFVILLLKEKIGGKSYEYSKALLNFELFLFILCIIFFIIGLIPIIGWIIALLLGGIFSTCIIIYNAIMMLLSVFNISDKKETKLPVPYEFV